MNERRKLNVRKLKLPRRALTNVDIAKFSHLIPHFRGIYMRNNLPSNPLEYETGIINLDDFNGPGTHWCGYRKIKNIVYWFDSYGNLKPTKEVIAYFWRCQIFYNYKSYQSFNSFTCGHLCLKFLLNIVKPKVWKNI